MARDGAEESDVIFMEPNEKGKKSNTQTVQISLTGVVMTLTVKYYKH